MAGIHEVSKLTGLSTDQINDVFDAILNLVRNGDRVIIRGFGSFREVTTKARVVTSPVLAGGRIEVPPAKTLRFGPSAATKQKLTAAGKARPAGEE